MNDVCVLGLNAYHGDSSAALLKNGELAAAVEEERYNRIKHWAGLPSLAAAQVLAMGGVERVEHLAISRDPKARFVDKLKRVAVRPGLWRRAADRAFNSAKLTQLPADLEAKGVVAARDAQFHFVEHHRSHLASAFFVSPFEEAAVVSVDGFGDFTSVMWGAGRGNTIDVLGSVQYPHSLGLYYTAITQLLGFPKYGDEYKMMGLSALGEPRYVAEMRQVVKVEDGQVRLNLDLFRHHSEGVEMSWVGGEPVLGNVYSQKLVELLGEPRQARGEILQRHMDLAASAQAVLEECYFAILNHVQKQTGMKAVCLAGGVALNCVANGMIFERTGFRDVYVQPAAHDAGTSYGAALYVWHQVLGKPRQFVMNHVYWGSGHDNGDIRKMLDSAGVRYHALSESELVDRTARHIADGDIMGWFQGRMEFGPRALGNRSILADPRRHDMKDTLNRRIKFREPFRPFCPSVLAESTGEYFESSYPSPFMVMAYKIKAAMRDRIPAVTHSDGTGRLQTVEKDANPLYWKLIHRFGEVSGVPILLNTSFNENEPIVETPQQALDCFLRTRMDALAVGNHLLLKKENAEFSESRRSFAEAESAV
ncbi:MAG: carbamoyltransferase C-terminal domain-containing protein [Bryobacteraceae bacterium]|nr:carbamoyltransferase C-terminal domain-containing protein [Bryobacteraceae bacterium]